MTRRLEKWYLRVKVLMSYTDDMGAWTKAMHRAFRDKHYNKWIFLGKRKISAKEFWVDSVKIMRMHGILFWWPQNGSSAYKREDGEVKVRTGINQWVQFNQYRNYSIWMNISLENIWFVGRMVEINGIVQTISISVSSA